VGLSFEDDSRRFSSAAHIGGLVCDIRDSRISPNTGRLFEVTPISCLEIVSFVLSNVVGTVHEILDAMDKLTREELRILKLGVDSRLADDDNDPALLASLKEAIAYADSHPAEAKSIDEVRALIPQWISESKSQARP
jgi:hypothetical protein